MPDANVTFSGPLFEADLARLAADLERDLVEGLAEEGLRAVRDELRPGHGVDTGAFEAGLRIGGEGGARVVYSPDAAVASWLEGTSERNARSTFKGYGIFTRATAATDRRAREVGNRAVGTYINRLR